MSGIEILLLIVGAIVLTAGYLLPMKNRESDKHVTAGQEKKITELVGKAVEDAKGRIEDIVDETVSYSMEKTERTMERISNEKIMAIHEYSDTVLAEINKNHEEEVFLYDMLNSKHDSLVETVSEAGKTVAEVRQTLQDAQITANEVKEAAKSREFVPMKPDASAEPERVIPSFSSKGSLDDPNVQLEEIIKKSIKTGKKKKATVPEKEVQKEEQGALLEQIAYADATPSLAQAIKLKRFSQDGKLTNEVIESIMSEEKPNQREKINIKYAEARRFIPASIPYEKTGEYILKALEYYHRYQERQKSRNDAR